MKSLTEYLTYNIPSRRGFVYIASEVRKLVQKRGIKEVLCLVNAMHIPQPACLLTIMNLGFMKTMKGGLKNWLRTNLFQNMNITSFFFKQKTAYEITR